MDAVGRAFDYARGITSNNNETNVTVTGNTIYGHVTTAGTRYEPSSAGIRIPASSGWTIQDNEIYGNTLGVYAYAGATNITINAGTVGPNIIRDNARGVVMSDGTVGVINENKIYDNNVTTWEVSNSINPLGVMNLGATELNTTNNWWGDATGPGDVGPGTGDKVSVNVNFDSWYTDAGMTTTNTDLATAKTNAHDTLTTAFAGYVVANYTGANWIILTGFKTDGDTAIDAATDLAGVTSAQNTATAGMAGVAKIQGRSSGSSHSRNINAATPNLPAQASPVAVGRVLGAFTGPNFDSPAVTAIKAQITDLIGQLIALLRVQLAAAIAAGLR